MLTIKELYDACRKWKSLRGTNIRNNSKGKPDKDGVQHGITLTEWRINESEDEEGDIYRVVTCKARDRGPQHSLQMIFYGDGSDGTTRAAVNCSCEYFMYYCEVALEDKGSSRIEEPIEMRIWSNGEEPNITNSTKVPIICKHLYQALYSGAAKRKPKGKSLEDKRKEALKVKEQEKREQAKEKLKEKREKEKETKETKERETKRKETKKPATIRKPTEPAKPPSTRKYAEPPKTKWKR